MKTPIRVEILGRKYTLRVEEDNIERTRTVAQKVNRRMRAFQRQHPEQAKLTTAIITALALGEDLQQERDASEAHTATLDEDLQALNDTLADALEEKENDTSPSPKKAPETSAPS